MCLLTNVKYKAYQMGFSFGRLGDAGGTGVSKIKFSEHGHVAYQIKGGDQ